VPVGKWQIILTRDRCYVFLNVNLAKYWRCLLKILIVLANTGFIEQRRFFSRKLAKIVENRSRAEKELKLIDLWQVFEATSFQTEVQEQSEPFHFSEKCCVHL
jgi:hypothetical protein